MVFMTKVTMTENGRSGNRQVSGAAKNHRGQRIGKIRLKREGFFSGVFFRRNLAGSELITVAPIVSNGTRTSSVEKFGEQLRLERAEQHDTAKAQAPAALFDFNPPSRLQLERRPTLLAEVSRPRIESNASHCKLPQ